MLFGQTAPKFVVGTNTLLLDYVKIEKDAPVLDMIEQESVITGKRDFIIKGKHWDFELVQHLWKVGSTKTYYETVKSTYEGAIGSLYRHRDAPPFTEQFILYSVEEYYLEQFKKQDILVYKFKSIDYVNIINTLTT